MTGEARAWTGNDDVSSGMDENKNTDFWPFFVPMKKMLEPLHMTTTYCVRYALIKKKI
jgi:hypothetical protein